MDGFWEQANEVAAAGDDATRTALYNRMQGLNPDGTRNPSYDVLLDVENLIDYMMIMLYIGNRDAPISDFHNNTKQNNWYGVRNRYGEEGFRFFSQDAENTLSPVGLYKDRNGPWPAGEDFEESNPQWVHQQLMSHGEYLVRFGDRVHEHFFNGGVLTSEASIARLQSRAGQIELAMIAESARWGDTKRPDDPYTKDDWQAAIHEEVQNYLPFRPDIVLDQFRTHGLYPSVVAPVYNQHGGEVASGFPLTMAAPFGTIYYTLDGSDPRLPGGDVSPDAQQYIRDITLTTLVSAGSTWKYLDDGTDQGTDWRQPGFDDGGWASGPGVLGYGDPVHQTTTVGYGPDPDDKYITTYFRHTFNLAGQPQFDGLKLELIRDDGAVVYINGTEVQRTNMPGGDIDYLTTTPTYISGSDESAFNVFSIDPGLLVEGENVIAVEIHQSDGQSSDISFDLRLTASSTTSEDPVLLTESALVRARALDGGQWSALNEAQFIVGNAAAAGNLAITELNYNPYAPSQAEIDAGFDDNDDFEFVELQNVGGGVIDLTGVQFVEEPEGITFDFTGSGVTLLGPGEFVVVARDTGAFAFRYDTVANMAGQYAGRLSNGGEWIKLEDTFGGTIQMFQYGDSNDAGWPDRADGNGSTLEVIDTGGDYSNPDNWRSSGEFLGSPGCAGQGPYDDVVINEALSHTDTPLLDSIELHNTSGSAVDIGGWWLSDSNDNYQKYRIPQGTSIPAGGYIVFDESHFNPAAPAPGQVPFALSGAEGDDVWLWQGDATGKVTYHVDHVEFGAALVGESFGRWVNSAGTSYFYPMTSRTLDPPGPNSGPRIGPQLLISEVMYNPGAMPEADDLEFIEVYNTTDQPVALTDWRLRKGLDFDFPVGTVLGPYEALVVVRFDPVAQTAKASAFRSHYGIDGSVQLVGGHDDLLNDDGDRVQLQDWDEPTLVGNPPQWIAPHPLEDEVDYEDTWAPSTDGGGMSLNRLGSDHWGDEPASWIAAAPTPGSAELPEKTASRVDGRYIFYNNSAFDTGPGRTDDDAIAPDKTALLPGGTASFENYTSYVRGINGIIVDIAGLPGAISATDFEFKTGNDNDPGAWDPVTTTPTVTMRPGEGINASDRVTIIFPDNEIQGQWLQVTVLAGENTGLEAPDVFYFGNAIGESGNSDADAIVNVQDALLPHANPRPFWDPAEIGTPYDYDRDERVDATDIVITRAHQTWSMTALRSIDLSGGKADTHDAVLAGDEGPGARGEGPGERSREIPPARMDWLYQFEQPNTRQRASRQEMVVEDAVDLLLAIDTP